MPSLEERAEALVVQIRNGVVESGVPSLPNATCMEVEAALILEALRDAQAEALEEAAGLSLRDDETLAAHGHRGCGNSGCHVVKQRGMATNAACRCTRTLRAVSYWLRNRAATLRREEKADG